MDNEFLQLNRGGFEMSDLVDAVVGLSIVAVLFGFLLGVAGVIVWLFVRLISNAWGGC